MFITYEFNHWIISFWKYAMASVFTYKLATTHFLPVGINFCIEWMVLIRRKIIFITWSVNDKSEQQ